jgi:hypothetical protein
VTYTKLFSSIITSTVWSEDHETRIVWITMLAMADKNGEVQGSVPGLARVAAVSLDGCRAAIKKFLSPDEDSRTQLDEGRRIEEIDGGWHLLNYGKYREMASKEEQVAKATARTQRYRERQKRNLSTGGDGAVYADSTLVHGLATEAEAEAEAEKKGNKDSAAVASVSPADPEVLKAFNAWNEAASRHQRWKQAQELSLPRRKALKARLRDAKGIEGFLAVLAKAEASQFIRHEMKGWGLDWFLKLANFAKVREGNYDNGGAEAGAEGPPRTADEILAEIDRDGTYDGVH